MNFIDINKTVKTNKREENLIRSFNKFINSLLSEYYSKLGDLVKMFRSWSPFLLEFEELL